MKPHSRKRMGLYFGCSYYPSSGSGATFEIAQAVRPPDKSLNNCHRALDSSSHLPPSDHDQTPEALAFRMRPSMVGCTVFSSYM